MAAQAEHASVPEKQAAPLAALQTYAASSGNQLPSAPTGPERVAISAVSPWDAATKRTVILLLMVVAVGIIWISREMIPVLVISGVIAYFLSPIVDLAERMRIPRTVTTLLLYALLIIGLILTPILLVPVLLAQLASLNFDVPTTAFLLFAWVGDAIANLPDTVEIMGFSLSLSRFTEQIEQAFRDFAFIPTLAEALSYIQQLISTATNLVSSTAAISFSVVGGILQVIVSFLLIFFLSLYLTKDAPRIRAYIEGLFPVSYQSEWADLIRRMGYIWNSFFRGQLLLCIVVGLTTWMALELVGMPGALLLAILAGALEIIPTLGPILSMVPAVIIALIQGSPVMAEYGINNFGFALITIAIYFIIQQLENYILVPRIIGDGVNLHPIVVLCGFIIGFNLAGILGALFSAPVIASMRVLGGYLHAKLLDYPPFLTSPARPPNRHPHIFRRVVTGEELAARDAARLRPHAHDADLTAHAPPDALSDSEAHPELAPGVMRTQDA